MSQQWMQCLVVTSLVAMALGWSSGRLAEAHSSDDLDQDNHQREKTLYIWAGDQARVCPDPDPAQSHPDGFNPHGISAAFRRNLLVTSDFINPVTTLNGSPGDVELRGSLRFWNLANREITRTVFLPEALGTMDVKLIPR